MTRVKFMTNQRNFKSNFYNPNLLPYPAGSKYPYLGIARVSPKVNGLLHHNLYYCDLEWSSTRVIHHTALECAEPAVKIDFGDEWGSPPDSCQRHPFLAMAGGHTDPRVFFSPSGEPLMVVGSNGKHNCLGQYIIDLRALIPNLGKKMGLEDVPIRFSNLTELLRPHLGEVEKNWFVMYDSLDANKDYLHYDYTERSIAPLEQSADTNKEYQTIDSQPSPQLVLDLLQDFGGDSTAANDLHQSSNSLLVTLCDFPCIPTIHNTVMIEILHLKYKNYFELFYRRYMIVMNATAPFNVLGRTGNLMYAGTDTVDMVYTISIVWDKENYVSHEPWDESIHGGRELWSQLDEEGDASEQARSSEDFTAREVEKKIAGYRKNRNAVDEFRSKNEHKESKLSKSLSPVPIDDEMDEEEDEIERSEDVGARKYRKRMSTVRRRTRRKRDNSSNNESNNESTRAEKNPFVSRWYHGWLDDVMMINFGLRDAVPGTIHVSARDVLECMEVVE
ncbi:uncharacterized protein V1516DRAFT_697034 [Lipomyces oligophaga]|uniref:uncharacterized protein n=1 Tax=Lipomyces oligophaga TaxID=45792 RepID=UPI0034CE8626